MNSLSSRRLFWIAGVGFEIENVCSDLGLYSFENLTNPLKSRTFSVRERHRDSALHRFIGDLTNRFTTPTNFL